jgi:rhodanese-related sulfurtransferase
MEIPAAIPSISPVQLARVMSRSPDSQIVDVRSPEEFATGHIMGARSVPLDRIEGADAYEVLCRAGISPDRPLYLACHAGLRAQRAAEHLREQGIAAVFLIEGGTQAWQAGGLPMGGIDGQHGHHRGSAPGDTRACG